MNEQIISRLIGLSGACRNNGKTPNTDAIVTNALLCCDSASPTERNIDTILSAITQEKYTISPSCETCPTPCGNTSDYDMTKYYDNPALVPLKNELLHETITLVQQQEALHAHQLPEIVYEAISYLGYELAAESYQNLIHKIKQMEV